MRIRTTTLSVVLCLLLIFGQGYVPAPLFGSSEQSFERRRLRSCLQATDSGDYSTIASPSPEAVSLKSSLLEAIQELNELKGRDGDFVIEYGVKGKELNETTRAPQKVDFYSISKDVGTAADRVIQICDNLAQLSPCLEPTAYLGDKENGHKAPLNGAWKLLFSTAADASFSSKNSTRGSARVQNIVDASAGRITNVIDFDSRDDGTEPPLKQLNVVIRAKSASKTRVDLTFRYAKVVLTKFFFIPLFGRRLSLYIPVPATFITRLIVLFGRIIRRQGVKKPPVPYFEVQYLDSDLRIHKTGEDNLFVQAKETWKDARPLLE